MGISERYSHYRKFFDDGEYVIDRIPCWDYSVTVTGDHDYYRVVVWRVAVYVPNRYGEGMCLRPIKEWKDWFYPSGDRKERYRTSKVYVAKATKWLHWHKRNKDTAGEIICWNIDGQGQRCDWFVQEGFGCGVEFSVFGYGGKIGGVKKLAPGVCDGCRGYRPHVPDPLRYYWNLVRWKKGEKCDPV